jgi:RES domain-containing protein
VRLWRISNYTNLSGIGGLKSSGRWHSRGTEIVYLADNPPAALLERLVHLEIDTDDVPSTYQLLAIDVSDDTGLETVIVNDLPPDWQTNEAITQLVGDRWLRERRTALLKVPSAITPHTYNWLLNPNHPDASNAKIVEVIVAPFDPRLF